MLQYSHSKSKLTLPGISFQNTTGYRRENYHYIQCALEYLLSKLCPLTFSELQIPDYCTVERMTLCSQTSLCVTPPTEDYQYTLPGKRWTSQNKTSTHCDKKSKRRKPKYVYISPRNKSKRTLGLPLFIYLVIVLFVFIFNDFMNNSGFILIKPWLILDKPSPVISGKIML